MLHGRRNGDAVGGREGGCGEVWFAGQGFRSVVDGWGWNEILRGGMEGWEVGAVGAEERKRVLAVGGQGPVGGRQRGCGVVGRAAGYAALLDAGGD